ncbi:retrovirus-related pol polyprotein from transposon TNT 1-94 [Tanacetum coccineum]
MVKPHQHWYDESKNVKPIAIHNIYSFYETESSKSESEDINEIDIETLTLEQYRTLSHKNIQVRIKRLEIGEKDAFEIKSPLLRELRDNTLSEKKSKDVMEHLRKEQLSDDWEELIYNPPVMDGIPSSSTSVQQECAMKVEPPHKMPISKIETFAEKVPPKENDLGSFVLPCIIGNTTVSNALADLGASSSVMSFSMFKRLGLGNPRPVNMVIEMADRSVQSPKGIVKNVLVKIHKFIFSVDFVILDIIEDDKVPIIQGRPMLATTHARIDVFGGKILVEVRKEEIIFNANEGATPVTISHVCVIKDFDVIDNFRGLDNLEQLLMDDYINGDLGNFL